MNGKIEELFELAAHDVRVKYDNAYWRPQDEIEEDSDWRKRFAELIVNECIACCERVISDPVPKSKDTWLNGGSQCIEEIKYHFDIKYRK